MTEQDPGKVRWNPECGCIEMIFAGQVDAAEMEALVENALDIAAERGSTWILADCSGLAGGHSVLDLYRLAERLAARGLAAVMHEAVILPTDQRYAPDVTFWRDAGRNRGLDVEVFTDRAAALAWIARPEPT